jgi:hypothetical protein
MCLTRAAENWDGSPRPTTAGRLQSYGMGSWSGQPRPLAGFGFPSTTILLEYYPVNYDNNIPPHYDDGYCDATYTLINDVRMDYPAFAPDAMPGISVFSSNQARWHTKGSDYGFTDGHAKFYRNSMTYKTDGSFSLRTISNTWTLDTTTTASDCGY